MAAAARLQQALRTAVRRVASAAATADASAPVGFVGLGAMGSQMARNLAAKGRQLVVCDANITAADALRGEHPGAVTVERDAAAVAKTLAGAGPLVSMLPSSPHVRQVYSSVLGSGAPPPPLCVDASTIAPAVSREVAAEVQEAGGAFVDAPVSGGVVGAKAGTLTFMVGGGEADVDAAKALLDLMGKNVVHCGDVGAGQAAKLANNLALAIQMASIAEALTLGVSLGVDPAKLSSIFDTSTSGCWSSRVNNPWPGVVEGAPAGRGYEGGFAARLMAKDLGLAVEAAHGVGKHLPMGSAVKALYDIICQDEEMANKDFGVYIKALEALDDGSD